MAWIVLDDVDWDALNPVEVRLTNTGILLVRKQTLPLCIEDGKHLIVKVQTKVRAKHEARTFTAIDNETLWRSEIRLIKEVISFEWWRIR